MITSYDSDNTVSHVGCDKTGIMSISFTECLETVSDRVTHTTYTNIHDHTHTHTHTHTEQQITQDGRTFWI
jgi:hypothetical protein